MANSGNNGGIGVLGIVGIVFVTLKLTGVIDWSWWLVTLPFWFGFAAIVSVCIIGAICVGLASLWQKCVGK